MDYRQRAAEIARAYGLDPEIFVRQIEVESGFDPRAVSPVGAGGLAQIMPATAQQPGFGLSPISDDARFDPETSLNFGAQYMRAMLDRYDGDYNRALAAYNAGPGRVDQEGGIPNIPETQNYVSQIMGGGGGLTVTPSSRGLRQDDEPQGLLGALGIQRRDPEAGGETAQPFYQRDTFRDLMGNLAIGFNEMRLNPSQAIPAIVARGQERRQEAASANRTIDWLSQQPGGQPYVEMINAGGDPAQAISAYTTAMRQDANAESNPNVQSVQSLPDGGAVYYMRDGSLMVRSVTGEQLEGEAAQEYVRQAQDYGAQLQQQIHAARGIGGITADIVSNTYDELNTVTGNIANVDNALAAIEGGAQSGFIYNMLPDITVASASLRNAMNRMGLNVISSVTFGALSESEMRVAMETAVPQNLRPPELQEWLENYRSAQVKARQALENAARFLSQPGNTLNQWLNMSQEERQRVTPGGGSSPAPSGGGEVDPNDPLGLRGGS